MSLILELLQSPTMVGPDFHDLSPSSHLEYGDIAFRAQRKVVTEGGAVLRPSRVHLQEDPLNRSC